MRLHRLSPPPASRGAGVSLLELLTTLSVGMVILGGIFAMLIVSQMSSAETMTISKVEYSAKLSVLKVQNDVIDSSVSSPGWSLADGAEADTLTFSRCTGSSDGKRVWSTPITYRQNGEQLLRVADGGQTVVSGSIQSVRFSLVQGVLRVTVTAQSSYRNRYFYNTTSSVDVVLRN